VSGASYGKIGNNAFGITASWASMVDGFHTRRKNKGQSQKFLEASVNNVLQAMARFDGLIADLPNKTQEYLTKISQSYTEITALMEEAQARGQEDIAQTYASMRDLAEAHFLSEAKAIGLNEQEMLETIGELSSQTAELINKDEDLKDTLRAEYDKDAQKSLSNLRKMADASGERIDQILSTGLPEDAAAQISRVSQGVADLKRKTQELESARGKGGSASRSTAVELEGLKIIGDTTAKLRADARGELLQEAQMQGELQRTSGERTAMMQPTRGEALVRALTPYNEATIATKDQAATRELTALGNKNVELRRLTGEEGAQSLALEQDYYQQRQGAVQTRDAATLTTMEREQDLTGQYSQTRAGLNLTMADILGAQAQNFNNLAMAAQGTITQGASSIGQILGGGGGGSSGAGGMDFSKMFSKGGGSSSGATSGASTSASVG